MSVDEFPQKQVAVLPYSFSMWSKLFLLRKSYWRACLYYSTFSTVQNADGIWLRCHLHFILIKVGLGLDG